GDRIVDIKRSYVEANGLFGDIVKVTPSSKVVGDMAQYMVANNLTKDDVMAKGNSLSFPDSVVSFFRGDIGQPEGGFPTTLQGMVLKGQPAYTERPNMHLPPLDLDVDFKAFLKEFGADLAFTDY